MGKGHLIKRSVTLKGHRTSVSLEQAFWDVLDREVARHGTVSFSQLILEVDLDRGEVPLASALRVAALRLHGKHTDNT